MLRGFPPKAFIIGSQKCGTTLLANLLGQHPDISLAKSKEPDIYSRFFIKGIGAFRNEFENHNSICLDASTSYSCACLPKYYSEDQGVISNYNGVVENIYSLVPDAKFIYIMRDPAARAYSAYWHQVRSGQESRPFAQAIKEDTYYIRTSNYFGQIELYLKRFSVEQFLFLTFEEFIQSPVETAKRCFEFLGLKSNVTLHYEGALNKSFFYDGIFGNINSLLKEIGGLNIIVKFFKPVFPKSVMKWGASKIVAKVPKMTEKDYKMFEGVFPESIVRLQILTGHDYGMWESSKIN